MAQEEAITMLLRFRDIGKAAGETITEHEAVLRRYGYVWWAWWTKPSEQVPRQLFAAFRDIARAHGLPIFLYDAGQALLFETRLSDLAQGDNGGTLLSPEPEATPAYHRSHSYQAWFHLDRIEPADPLLITKFAYVRVDEFFATTRPEFAPFYGRRVRSLDELYEQDRATWFMRRLE